MRIHHSRPEAGFLVVPNETVRDERLSIAARGMLAYLLSRPDGWDTSADKEWERARKLRAKGKGEGREAMRAVFAELKKAGYLHTKPLVDPATGRWATEMHLFDEPRQNWSPPSADDSENGRTDVRVTDSPDTRTSVRPGEAPEPVDNPGRATVNDADSISPGRTDVRVTDVRVTDRSGTRRPVSRTSLRSTDYVSTEDENQHRIGHLAVGNADAPHPEEPIANSQKRRVHDGPELVANDAQTFPQSVQVQSPATDRNAREGEPERTRTCEFDECPVPETAAPAGARYHIGCGLAVRRGSLSVVTSAMPEASSYPDDHRDELPEDYGDADYVA